MATNACAPAAAAAAVAAAAEAIKIARNYVVTFLAKPDRTYRMYTVTL